MGSKEMLGNGRAPVNHGGLTEVEAADTSDILNGCSVCML